MVLRSAHRTSRLALAPESGEAVRLGTPTMQRVWTRTVRANPCGRDLVVGDVHGCFRTLDRALCELRFDAVSDRFFGVGDLVDLGPHSAEALVWIESRFEAATSHRPSIAIA